VLPLPLLPLLLTTAARYGLLTGMKAYYGLYAALAPAVMYSIFGQ